MGTIHPISPLLKVQSAAFQCFVPTFPKLYLNCGDSFSLTTRVSLSGVIQTLRSQPDERVARYNTDMEYFMIPGEKCNC